MADQRLIPAGIRDVSTLAMNALIDRLGHVPLDQLLIYLIDNVTESALPHLAEQFSATGYDGWALAQGETDRRELITRAIELHRRKGTPWAVKTALKTAGINARLIEWFMQTPPGPPHTCIAEIGIADRGLTTDLMRLIDGLIHEYKPVRVHMTVRAAAVTEATIYRGVCLTISHTITLHPLEQG